MKRWREWLGLGAILALALALRAWRLGHDLPYVYHPDEPVCLTVSLNILRAGDLNPRFFHYPSLFLYLNALAYAGYYAIGRARGVFQAPTDVLPVTSLTQGVTYAPMPTAVLLSRSLTVAFGVGSVALVYLLARRLWRRPAVGALAALLLAVSLPNVTLSRHVTPDTFMTFFSLAALWAALWVLAEGRLWHYAVAGACVGLTVSTKYNGGLIVAPLLLAHAWRAGRAALRQPQLYLALGCAAAAFVVATPFALLDAPAFLRDMLFEAGHYAEGHIGMEGESLRWYLRYIAASGPLPYLLGLGGIALAVAIKDRPALLTASFPAVYFAFIALLAVRNDRTLLPVTPFVFMLAAWLLVRLADLRHRWASPLRQRLWLAGLVALTALTVGLPLRATVAELQRLSIPDSRETARLWLAEHLPEGARVAVEGYGPYVDPARYRPQGFMVLIEQPYDWYAAQGFEYLVFSEQTYGRYFKDRARYAAQVAAYEELWARAEPLLTANARWPAIRVYRLR